MSRTLLADTHLLLWAAAEPERLPAAGRAALADPANRVLFSAASIWEVAIKTGLGRVDFAVDAAALSGGLRTHGWTELPVTARHAAAVRGLPDLHRNPFDRLLVAQAGVEGVVLITHDPVVAQYPGRVELV